MRLKKTATKAEFVGLQEAVERILLDCQRSPHGFFFMVGAGVSSPSVPLATKIVQFCREALPGKHFPEFNSPMEEYCATLAAAHPSPEARRRFFASFIEKGSISPANLRLAHLLQGEHLSRLVVTTNFDDYLARALHLFGARPVVCDHVAEGHRIDPEDKAIQVLHLHGSFHFYDSANLASEIIPRSRATAFSPTSLSNVMVRILQKRSPLVVGYSGWQEDLFMTCLRARMQSGHPHDLFWFCYRKEDADNLPGWLLAYPQARIVLPDSRQAVPGGGHDPGDGRLPAQEVFDAMIRELRLEPPTILEDPITFLADQLANTLPIATADADPYQISNLVRDLRDAAKRYKQTRPGQHNSSVSGMATVRRCFRRADYLSLLSAARTINVQSLDSKNCLELVTMLQLAIDYLPVSPESASLDFATWIRLAESAFTLQPSWSEPKELIASTYLKQALIEVQAEHYDRALVTLTTLVTRFKDETATKVRLCRAKAGLYQGMVLNRLSRTTEALDHFETVTVEYAQDKHCEIQAQAAKAAVNKGIILEDEGHLAEALGVYKSIDDSFGGTHNAGTDESVAYALFSSSRILIATGDIQAGLATVTELLRRYNQSREALPHVFRAMLLRGKILLERGQPDAALQQFAEIRPEHLSRSDAKDWIELHLRRGVALWQLARSQEALQDLTTAVTRCQEEKDVDVDDLHADSLYFRAATLEQLGKEGLAQRAYEMLVKLFAETEADAVQEPLARAHWKLGIIELIEAKRFLDELPEQARVHLDAAREHLENARRRMPEIWEFKLAQLYGAYLRTRDETNLSLLMAFIAQHGNAAHVQVSHLLKSNQLPGERELLTWSNGLRAANQHRQRTSSRTESV
jgi:tetratricopeptide (TPR) repeat protein